MMVCMIQAGLAEDADETELAECQQEVRDRIEHIERLQDDLAQVRVVREEISRAMQLSGDTSTEHVKAVMQRKTSHIFELMKGMQGLDKSIFTDRIQAAVAQVGIAS